MKTNKSPSLLLTLLLRKHKLERELDDNIIRQEELKLELKNNKNRKR